jgi:hypothetical protein
MNCELMFTYDTPALRQTGSRNLMGPKIVAEKNATKNEHIYSMCIKINSRQTGSRNLLGPKTLPTIWGTYMKLVTKYQISAINSC